MTFPDTWNAIQAMARRRSFHTRMARAIARKAGLKMGRGQSPAPTTLIDASPGPVHIPLTWQWTIDLTGYEKVRLDVRHQTSVHLFYSASGAFSSIYDPADWSQLSGFFEDLGTTGTLNASTGQGLRGDPLFWMDLPDEAKTTLRVCFAQDDGHPDAPSPYRSTDLGGPWGVILQAI